MEPGTSDRTRSTTPPHPRPLRATTRTQRGTQQRQRARRPWTGRSAGPRRGRSSRNCSNGDEYRATAHGRIGPGPSDPTDRIEPSIARWPQTARRHPARLPRRTRGRHSPAPTPHAARSGFPLPPVDADNGLRGRDHRRPPRPRRLLRRRAGSARHRQDVHRGPRDQGTRRAAPVADRRRRAVALGGREHARRRREGRRSTAALRREEGQPQHDRDVDRTSLRTTTAGFIDRGRRHGLRHRRHRVGLREHRPCSAPAASTCSSSTRPASSRSPTPSPCAASARNLLLLGDPQQLPQVSQGTHPEPVDESALGWLAEGHDALPAELGYFLERTWRMHPDLCAPVSDAVVRGQAAFAGIGQCRTATRRCRSRACTPSFVDHHGNATYSPEESRGGRRPDPRTCSVRRWTDPSEFDGTRPLDRVRHPRGRAVQRAGRDRSSAISTAAGLTEVEVGTVDKFQGREAAVAIVSMTRVRRSRTCRAACRSCCRATGSTSRSPAASGARSSSDRHALTQYMPSTPGRVWWSWARSCG